MTRAIRDIIRRALDAAAKDGEIKTERPAGKAGWLAVPIIVERPKKEEFGDFSTNAAMLLAPLEGRPAREIADALARRIAADPSKNVSRCEVAGPGFINVFLEKSWWHERLKEMLEKGTGYGDTDIGAGKRVQVEFVSANPTGPLHIGHGRGAAVGDSLANILKAAGFEVTKEYYINDVGRQMQTLGESVRARYIELCGLETRFPEDGYKGEYVKEIARDYLERHGCGMTNQPSSTANRSAGEFQEFARGIMLERIKKDLADFGVEFDVWKSEKALYESGLVGDTIEELKKRGHVYEGEGAVWFRTTAFKDDKDRVLVKADGQMTYFASDIAYHREKVKRGFDRIVNVWGADHHGYEARVRALFKAFGHDERMLKIIFIQLVALLRGGAPVAMGKREGEFVTLREVMDEVGKDATRFFFLMRKSDAHLDFDLELAKRQAPENPVYYVQYCHARIMSITAFAGEKGVSLPQSPDMEVLEKLELKEETDIIKHLAAFEEVVEKSAVEMEPHRITFYLTELAGLFHPYYNRNRVVTDDTETTFARLFLCRAVAGVTRKGLGLLGVGAPVTM
ncbi:MAG: arginine--tRNA ligase [Deltaproteobacteria bacterium]|nr:arginine--tRNA ligase [Deltaproteobacteria bacterium]